GQAHDRIEGRLSQRQCGHESELEPQALSLLWFELGRHGLNCNRVGSAFGFASAVVVARNGAAQGEVRRRIAGRTSRLRIDLSRCSALCRVLRWPGAFRCLILWLRLL